MNAVPKSGVSRLRIGPARNAAISKPEKFAAEKVGVGDKECDRVDAGHEQKNECDEIDERRKKRESYRKPNRVTGRQRVAGCARRIDFALDNFCKLIEEKTRDKRRRRREQKGKPDK